MNSPCTGSERRSGFPLASLAMPPQKKDGGCSCVTAGVERESINERKSLWKQPYAERQKPPLMTSERGLDAARDWLKPHRKATARIFESRRRPHSKKPKSCGNACKRRPSPLRRRPTEPSAPIRIKRLESLGPLAR